MSNLAEATKTTFAWHALSDACEKCQSLNGREWTGQDVFQEYLWDMIWGNIWDLWNDNSMAHGQEQYNCRCQLEVRVEYDVSALEELVEFEDLLRMI